MKNLIDMESHIREALLALEREYPEYKTDDPHNVDTPKRIAKAWMEMCRGYDDCGFDFTTFPNDRDCSYSDNWIYLTNIEFSSLCQHHFMPFYGIVDIGYVPAERIVGISKLARVTEYFAKRPQVQERLGDDIVDFLYDNLRPLKVAVRIRSTHTCIACRGIESRNSEMITYHSYNQQHLKEFMEMIR